MIITWYGEGCFRIQNGETSVLIDIPDSSSGLSAPRGKYNVFLKTLTPYPFEFGQEDKEKEGAIVWGAGEYDIAGVTIRGFSLLSESSQKFFKTAYLLSWDDITIGLLGHISEELPPTAFENFEEADILIGPGGGAPFLDQEKMVRVIKQITPKIFIPSFYKIPGLKRKSEDAQGLLERMQAGDAKPQEKFVFKKKDLEEIKKTQVICLQV